MNIIPNLTPTAIRKFFPYDCSACPARQLTKRYQVDVEVIPYTLPGQAFKAPWTAPDGTPTRSLSGNLHSFTALDLIADYAFDACASNRCGIIKHLQKLSVLPQ